MKIKDEGRRMKDRLPLSLKSHSRHYTQKGCPTTCLTAFLIKHAGSFLYANGNPEFVSVSINTYGIRIGDCYGVIARF